MFEFFTEHELAALMSFTLLPTVLQYAYGGPREAAGETTPFGDDSDSPVASQMTCRPQCVPVYSYLFLLIIVIYLFKWGSDEDC